jgi:hypothetical protein
MTAPRIAPFGRPPESGRYVVVGRSPDGRVGDVTPAPYYARTLAHSVLVFRTALTF